MAEKERIWNTANKTLKTQQIRQRDYFLYQRVETASFDTYPTNIGFRPFHICSVADPDPGCGPFLTPGSGIQNRFFSDPGSRIQNPYF